MKGMYRTAPISLAICKPWGYAIGDCLFSRSLPIVSLSSHKSNFVPTRMIGVFGAWCEISGNHYHISRKHSQIQSQREMLLVSNFVPLFWRFRKREGRRERNRLRIRLFVDMIMDGDDRSLLGLLYPIILELQVPHRPWNWQSNYQTCTTSTIVLWMELNELTLWECILLEMRL